MEKEELIKEEPIVKAAPKKAVPKKKGTTTLDAFVNLRNRPSINAEVVKLLYPGEQIEILSSKVDSGFIKIVSDGVEGYCLKELIEVHE